MKTPEEKEIRLKDRLENSLGREATLGETENAKKDIGLIVLDLQEDVATLEEQMARVLKELKLPTEQRRKF